MLSNLLLTAFGLVRAGSDYGLRRLLTEAGIPTYAVDAHMAALYKPRTVEEEQAVEQARQRMTQENKAFLSKVLLWGVPCLRYR